MTITTESISSILTGGPIHAPPILFLWKYFAIKYLTINTFKCSISFAKMNKYRYILFISNYCSRLVVIDVSIDKTFRLSTILPSSVVYCFWLIWNISVDYCGIFSLRCPLLFVPVGVRIQNPEYKIIKKAVRTRHDNSYVRTVWHCMTTPKISDRYIRDSAIMDTGVG